MAKDVVIVAVPPSGQVTQLGSDQGPGIWVEDASWDHSLPDHGARQCQFKLGRRPEQEWPDLQPFTPLIIHKAGSVAWTGRIQQTPTIRGRENEITVIGEGWPAHLKDDAVEKWFVHNDLTAWRNTKSFAGTNLATYPEAFGVTLGGQIAIAVPNGTTVPNGGRGGVTLDAGPFNTIKRVVTFVNGGGHAGFALKYFAGDTPTAETETAAISGPPIVTTAAFSAFTLTTPRRYVTLYMNVNALTNVALDTAWGQFQNIICFSDTAYESGNVSIFKASQGIAALLPYAPKVSQSTLGITTTTFSLPDFAGPVTAPSDYIDALNDYHGYQWFLRDAADGGSPALIFRPVPTSPTIVANVGAGIEFNDASRNDGSEIYNRVIVEYTDAAGNTAREERTTGGLSVAIAEPDIAFDTLSTLSASVNPGFETAGGPPATGWAVIRGQITRDVVIFDTGAASGRLTSDAGGQPYVYVALTGLTPGKSYQLRYRVRAAATWGAGGAIIVAALPTPFDPLGIMPPGTYPPPIPGSTTNTLTNAIGLAFTTRSITFPAPYNGTAYLSLSAMGPGFVTAGVDILYLDGLTLLEARPTIIDRQGFIRTKVLTTGSRLTAAAAQQIGDVYLQAHRFTPLRGTLTIEGAALRTLLGDVPIPAHLVGGRLLGDAVLINETDPDLGTIGRVGYLASAAYTEASDTTTCAIDTQKDFVGQLLSRLGIFLPS